jgi:8-oxo-dGTP pyrophosphatase MutT (NUDIX family)
MERCELTSGTADNVIDAADHPSGDIVEAPEPRRQYAALPFRLAVDGRPEILLITSRTTRRWIIPKGWPMGQRAPHKVAELEAMEEAGVSGRIGKQPLGVYHYDKLLGDGSTARCRVDVYGLEVRKEKASWPEKKKRERRWMGIDEAASLADDAELVPLILGLMAQTPSPA